MAVFDPVTLAEEWAAQKLSGASGVTALLGTMPNTRVYPAFAPAGATLPYLTHDLAGAAQVTPIGPARPSVFPLLWEVTVWGEGQSRQALRPIVKAALAALLGDNMAGTSETFLSSDGDAWAVNASYAAAVPAPGGPEVSGEGVYQRVTHALRLELQALRT